MTQAERLPRKKGGAIVPLPMPEAEARAKSVFRSPEDTPWGHNSEDLSFAVRQKRVKLADEIWVWSFRKYMIKPRLLIYVQEEGRFELGKPMHIFADPELIGKEGPNQVTMGGAIMAWRQNGRKLDQERIEKLKQQLAKSGIVVPGY